MIICSTCYQRYSKSVSFADVRVKVTMQAVTDTTMAVMGVDGGWWNTEIHTVQSIVLCNRGFGVGQRNQGRK